MRAFTAHQLSYQLPTGRTLFTNISCTLNAQLTGLVGHNGIGKSMLGKLLSGRQQPSSGTLHHQAVCAVFEQHSSTGAQSLSQALGLADALMALEQIEQGAIDTYWFDRLGEHWSVRETFANTCQTLALPEDPELPLEKLSGGQIARVQLWRLFNNQADWLLLDEPSNHLDRAGKEWLLEQMRHYPGQILLISHDRFLLREMQEIWELDHRGLNIYGGGYDRYAVQKQQEQAALERQLSSAEDALKQAQKQAQLEYEKAQQRAAKGRKLAKDGSQAKIILDRQKERASASASTRSTQAQHQQTLLQHKIQQLQARQSEALTPTVAFGQVETGKRTLVQLVNATLPYGHSTPINLSIREGEKLHLTGSNGSGKSTLLKVLQGRLPLVSGDIILNGTSCYLDQQFNLLNLNSTLLDSLIQSTHLSISEKRTLLAQAGFRGDRVHHRVSCLSGGERMKLALLVASHQPHTPLLLLDEPDNHLDIGYKNTLADTLKLYTGALLLVTHDEVFAERCQIDTQYSLDS
ncbi:MAG: ATP-binding cassette domain-containing protein [Nitrincola lacisaponensis]|uniref:ATP-binding cassette domain-containing protein n=1 Tax=Nitrincola lacisaponensis TaxID=267850 RepID=UPI0039187620